MSNRKQAAFTLVELLVVISIIGILVSLISAGVIAAVNRANQAVSMNNQKELWQAVQTYESRKQRYPGYAYSAIPGRQASWVVAIMPYAGMNDLYERWIDPAVTDITPTIVGIPLLICPGDDQETPGGPWTSYVVNTGIPDSPTGASTGETRANGLFFDHRLSLTTPRITTNSSDVAKKDGLSNTLGMAENRRAYMWTGYAPGTSITQEYLLGFNWEHLTGTNANVSWLRFPVNQKDTSNGHIFVDTAVDSTGARINGPHPGVAIVMFADGHARALSETIDFNVYNKLCTPDGSVMPVTSWPIHTPLDSAEYIR